jgi:hypothetical protein
MEIINIVDIYTPQEEYDGFQICSNKHWTLWTHSVDQSRRRERGFKSRQATPEDLIDSERDLSLKDNVDKGIMLPSDNPLHSRCLGSTLQGHPSEHSKVR